jgi:hypothetical protein
MKRILNKKKQITALFLFFFTAFAGFSQESSFKTSGYFQGQFQYGEQNASIRVGTTNADSTKNFSRFGIRRGRIKFSYDYKLSSSVFQIDITEKGVGVKDAYIYVKDPWKGLFAVQAGIFNRPFGYEISYSSSQRESPERAGIFKEIFSDERDIGAMFIANIGEKQGLPVNFKLETGLFAGNGIKVENDNTQAFISHLSANKMFNNLQLGLGVSFHNEKANNYLGFDFQFALISSIGRTKLNVEYILGNKSTNFDGGYAMIVQEFGKFPLSAVGKYEWFNQQNNRSTTGCGLLWRINNFLLLQTYYEFVQHLDNANVLTIRLQYKF